MAAARLDNEYVRYLCAHARDFAFEIDADGVTLGVTQAAERILGRPCEDIVGRSLFDFASDEDALQVATAFRDACATGASVRGFEMRVRRPDDESRCLRVDAHPVEQEGPAAFRGIARDVSSEKAARADAEDLRARLERTLRATRDCLVEWPDLTRDTVEVAPELARELGLPSRGPTTLTSLLSTIVRADRARLRNALRDHLRQGTPFELVVRLRGEAPQRRFLVRAEVSLKPGASQLGLLASMRAMPSVDEGPSTLEAALEIAGIGVFEWQVDAGACRFDEGACRMLGYEIGSLPQSLQSWRRMVHPEDHERFDGVLSACCAVDGERFRLPLRVRCVDASWRVIDVVGQSAHAKSGANRVVGAMIDKHEQHEAIQGLTRAGRRADLVSASRADFFASMSRDMREALFSILGVTEIAPADEPSAASLRDRIDVVRRNAKMLEATVDDVRDLAKIEADGFACDAIDFDLQRMLDDLVEGMRPKASNKGVPCSLHCEPGLPTRVVGDPALLRKIVQKLYANAIKFTSSGFVRVVARCLRETDRFAEIEVTVEDSGCGVGQEQLLELQLQLGGGDDPLAFRDGAGTGLYVSQRLAEAIGGRIELRSEAGVGTAAILRVLLPLGVADVNEAEAIDAELVDASSTMLRSPLDERHMLLVEARAGDRKLLVDFLERAGAEVPCAADDASALESLSDAEAASARIAMVVLDMQLATGDAFEIARRLRAGGFDGPILGLTDHGATGDAERCLASGCDAFAMKPVGASRLVDLCAGLLDQYEADRVV